MVSTPEIAALTSVMPVGGSGFAVFLTLVDGPAVEAGAGIAGAVLIEGKAGGRAGGLFPRLAAVVSAGCGFDSGEAAASISAIVLSPLELLFPELPVRTFTLGPRRGFRLAIAPPAFPRIGPPSEIPIIFGLSKNLAAASGLNFTCSTTASR